MTSGSDHGHDHHDHHHGADAHAPIEHDDETSLEFRLLEQAIRELLIETNVLTAADIHRQIDDQESRTPAMGSRIVAKAWTDEAFKSALIEDPKATITRLGIDVSNTPQLRVLENTDQVHHVVVCTLCSCYPRMILGVPPAWYKSREYRSRVVREARPVLAEFGVDLPDSVEVRVVDSTADLRYLVIPRRPEGTDAMTEDELSALVGRDAMIGTGVVRAPGA